jgi:hypothetical protein
MRTKRRDSSHKTNIKVEGKKRVEKFLLDEMKTFISLAVFCIKKFHIESIVKHFKYDSNKALTIEIPFNF